MMPRETAVSKSSAVQVSPPGATRRWCVCIMMIALVASTGRVSAFSFFPTATKKAGFSVTKSGRFLQQRQPLQRSPGPWPLHRSISTPLAVSTSPPPPSTSSSTLTESLDVDHSSGNNSLEYRDNIGLRTADHPKNIGTGCLSNQSRLSFIEQA